ncbi:hypothetical protein LTR37_013400 [Vermiconidia calcicola]|uniref:Uncharacterized protein n=1 Tax=Vermiconidia calcicola TaxID=1690605 RepID=A0ACC3MWI9_9PEZI|nr:hypothetical protein LTR37_013400 [Vermiconidia calcicola]
MACPFAGSGPGMAADHSSQGAKEAVQEVPIPQPPPTMLLGNFPDMDPSFPAREIQRFADIYGEIYFLELASRTVVLSTQELINEVCDQERFHKDIPRTLLEARALTGDGLFTSAHEDGLVLKREENWWKAHRLLVPAFGPLGLRKMFDDMLDISAQMVLRWDRMGEHHAIDCSGDFTRLAFDTIGLCSFGYRFNEFYTDEVHPFAKQMADVLKMSGQRANRTVLENMLHRWEEHERQDNIKKMHDLVNQIVAERKTSPKPDAKDLLNTMLFSVDRDSGETLSEQNVANNVVTFLVAGHETTSATLSFMWYNLLKHPEAFHKAQKEVDDIVGDQVLSLDMLPKLTYIDACIKETLRLNSPIPLVSVNPKEDTSLAGGKYRVKKGDVMTINNKGLHHDPMVWGQDHNEFKPERFLDGKFQALPPNSWKPFGNGLRACIGRGFAEQEMVANTAMILQRFSPEMADLGYDLMIKSTLTIKPDGFFMKVRRRPHKSLLTGIPGGVPSEVAKKQTAEDDKGRSGAVTGAKPGQKVRIFYGGNSGTCEGFAQSLQTTLEERGVQAEIASLDSATENLSKDVSNVIITASYEGQPPDNAKKFVSWLERLGDADALKGPKLIDDKLHRLGAETIVPAGLANVKTDLLGPFDDWSDSLVKHVLGAAGAAAFDEEKPSIKVLVERTLPAKNVGDEKIGVGTVLKNDLLADVSVGPAKKHMDVRLPDGMKYEAGDYLVIQPRNPNEAVQQVMRYFGYDEHTRVRVEGSKKKYLPDTPTSIEVFLRDHVELGTPVTQRQLKTIATYTTRDDSKRIVDDDVSARLTESRYTVIDVLVEYSIDLPLSIYMDMLLPLTPRQYSISSSPLAEGHRDIASVTYDIHKSPALSGHGIFEGACSTFLAFRKPGDAVSCFVRTTNINFRLPGDLETPIMMFAAGTGIAPMRAFLQERATIARANASRKLGPALLFYGSRDAQKDFLYKHELAEWEKLGIVNVYGAHSRMPNAGTEGHPKYVQDAIWAEREQCAELFRQGGKIYLCGSAARLGQSCAEVCKKIYTEKTGKSEAEAEEWLQRVKTDRFISDVY